MIDEKGRPFIMFEKDYLKIKEVSYKKGNEVVMQPFTGNLKVLYRYMLDRYLFFKGTGNEFYDNQVQLADAIGVSERTVVKLVSDLCATGLVEKSNKTVKGACHSNAYIVHDIFDQTKFDCGANEGKKCTQKRGLKSVVYETPEPPADHPSVVEIPFEEEAQKPKQEAVKPKINASVGVEYSDAPF